MNIFGGIVERSIVVIGAFKDRYKANLDPPVKSLSN
jgi:hypothetical protein